MAGYSSEITHQGKTFHIQTEDKGLSSHGIESIIYRFGAVLSRKSFYTAFLGNTDLKNIITRLIKEQHSTILKEITKGKFDHL